MTKLNNSTKINNSSVRARSILLTLAQSNLLPKFRQIIDAEIDELSRQVERIRSADGKLFTDSEDNTRWTTQGNLMGRIRDLERFRFDLELMEAQAQEVKHIFSRQIKR